MDLFSLLMQLISGAAGGNLVGGIFKNSNLGTLGNSLAGLVGGGLGSAILSNLLGTPVPPTGAEPDISVLLTQVLGGGAGGGVMTIIVAFLQRWLGR